MAGRLLAASSFCSGRSAATSGGRIVSISRPRPRVRPCSRRSMAWRPATATSLPPRSVRSPGATSKAIVSPPLFARASSQAEAGQNPAAMLP
jgi:hypothetical protein